MTFDMSIDPAQMDMILRISLAFVLGGLIGMERESMNRPAGFRTHILVCVGSALVMYTNILLSADYLGEIPIDPGRIGAQVVSGIGFLGAGTIIKEGLSVKGLTTAASLWVVACIGLSVGSGYYLLSIFTTIFILLILQTFGWLEAKVNKHKREALFYIEIDNMPGQIGKLTHMLSSIHCNVKNVSVTNLTDDISAVQIIVKYPKGVDTIGLIEVINQIKGIRSIERVNQ